MLPRIHNLISSTVTRQESGILTHCRESNASGVIYVPWDQVESAEAVSDSMMLLSLRVGRSFGHNIYRDASIEMLIGPCPARSLQSTINDCVALSPLRASMRDVLVIPEMDMDDLVDAR